MFNIIPPDSTIENHDHNWRKLQQTLKSGAFNPIPPSGGPTISGSPGPVVTQGYFAQALTDVLFFNITFYVPSSTLTITFTAGQYLVLPQPLVLLGSASGGYPQTVFPLTGPSTGGIATSGLTLTNNGRQGTLANLTGGTLTYTGQSFSIQGFYFTGK